MTAPTRHYLDFERPIAELEAKIEELSKLSETAGPGAFDQELAALKHRVEDMRREAYSRLDSWQKTQVARHPVVGGVGRFRGMPVVVMGHEKGHDTTTRLKHNFGMARPEGYRKAVRLMDMAEQFQIPVITFVDTAGAYPGVGAEERGQGEAIARSTERCLTLTTPMVATIVGEGGSGGALAIAAANRVLILEHSIYSVISPEAGSSILFRDRAEAPRMAKAMKITAQDLIGFGIVDRIIPEPSGGAHSDPKAAIKSVGDAVEV